jgi:hypothetical protein
MFFFGAFSGNLLYLVIALFYLYTQKDSYDYSRKIT